MSTMLQAHLWSVWLRAARIFHENIGRLRVQAQVILQLHCWLHYGDVMQHKRASASIVSQLIFCKLTGNLLGASECTFALIFIINVSQWQHKQLLRYTAWSVQPYCSA